MNAINGRSMSAFFLMLDYYSELKLPKSSKFHHLNSQAKQLFIYFYIYILSCIYTDIPLYKLVADLNKKAN